MRTPARLLLAVALLAACLCSAASRAHAQAAPFGWPDRTHLIGLVTGVSGPTNDPTSFVLQLGTLTAQVDTVPRTRFVARSLEAQVENFVTGDYAQVTVRRLKGETVAVRIVYDVAPFPPLRSFTGTVQWVSPDGMRFRLRVDPGRVLAVRIRPQTRFHAEGRITDVAPLLVRGETVQVLALVHNGLDAYEIDLTRNPSTFARGQQ